MNETLEVGLFMPNNRTRRQFKQDGFDLIGMSKAMFFPLTEHNCQNVNYKWLMPSKKQLYRSFYIGDETFFILTNLENLCLKYLSDCCLRP